MMFRGEALSRSGWTHTRPGFPPPRDKSGRHACLGFAPRSSPSGPMCLPSRFYNSTVPPCLQEARSRREQRGWTEARTRGGPQGPDTSPSRREAARREQAQRDNLPLVSSDNGEAPSRLSRAAREGYRPPRYAGPFHQMGPSLCAAARALLRHGHFDRRQCITGAGNCQD